MTSRKTTVAGKTACAVAAMLAGGGFALSQFSAQAQSGERLTAADLDAQNRLRFPTNAERWIGVGSAIGSEYSEEPFDPASPGFIGVVQMEPTAYDYFMENGEYADGTMFLLSFYQPQEKPEPELPGFVQGELAQQEIHLIDSQRFAEEGRAFYLFTPDSTEAVEPLGLGSPCFTCHIEHGDFDATFIQFYPRLREHIADLAN